MDQGSRPTGDPQGTGIEGRTRNRPDPLVESRPSETSKLCFVHQELEDKDFRESVQLVYRKDA